MSGAATKDGSAFWRFSLAFYGRAAVQDACLALQDEGGADVNMVLYLLFAASEQRALTAAAVADLDASLTDWRDQVVRPLRGVRRALKHLRLPDDAETEPLRNRIKAVELESERLQQEAMYRHGGTLEARRAEPADAAAGHIECYEQRLGHALPRPAVDSLLAELRDYCAQPVA